MNLQKKLIQLSEYKCSFKYVDSYFLISMTYPKTWSIIPSEDRSIDVAEEDGVTFYAAPIETDIEKAFNLIDITVSYNLDIEKKMALLKYNIGKLQELFAEKDLEELETIEFVFKEKTRGVTKSSAPKKRVQRKPRQRKAKVENEAKITMVGGEDGGGDDIEQISIVEANETTSRHREPTANMIGEGKYLEEIER